jgi:hypothetical protein
MICISISISTNKLFNVRFDSNETIPTDATHCQLTSTIIKFNDDVNNEVDVPIEAVLVSWDVELYPGIEKYTINLLG